MSVKIRVKTVFRVFLRFYHSDHMTQISSLDAPLKSASNEPTLALIGPLLRPKNEKNEKNILSRKV